MLSSLIPPAFLMLALAHFMALLSPGPDFFLITGYAVRYRLAGSALICFGIASGNAVYIALVIGGWQVLKESHVLFSAIQWGGAAYLLYIGYHLLKSRERALNWHTASEVRVSKGKQFFLGLASAILNPKNALFYMSLMTVILGRQVSVEQQVFCGVWMVCVVLVWDLAVASFLGHSRVQHLLSRKIHRIEQMAGGVLCLMAVFLFISV
ncbi:Threonine efflux protein [Vibrio aerogenes CECT 7868]|uniref:Threonine efflux protein n=1 Tax=Vibrio aerogenes CECT 7868 TaxID=1216006 RepID=A0A1M6C4L6_9VIBR|nr:LysE family translocator [Vibrio aerogenes]SHI55977.1 Threonine efflux protein [Vibrio aerogenes CECT 7868]